MWHDRRVHTMMIRKQLWHTKFAGLLLLFMAGETRPSMEIWRAQNARRISFKCCTHVYDIRDSAPVELSELRGIGAEPAGVSAPSPSGKCRMHIHVRRVRLSTMHARDGSLGSGLLLDLDVQVKGPSPRCDGSFAHLKVWDSSNGIAYRSAFSYWGGWLNITTVEHAASAPPDRGEVGGGDGGERLRRHTIVLPAEGRYWLEVLYDSEGYIGLLDKGEGFKLPPEMLEQLEPARTVIEEWLNVPAACFYKANLASSPGCDCNDGAGRRRHLYQSWPGYWAENRTLYVPLFHPLATRWAPGPSGVHSSAARYLLRRFSGVLLVSGTSRQRALYVDILMILGSKRVAGRAGEVELAADYHRQPSVLIEPRPETRVKFFRTVPMDDFNGWGRIDERHRTDYMEAWLSRLDQENLCTSTSRQGFVIFSDGVHFVASVAGPRGLAKASAIVNDTLTVLARRCKGTRTILMVASEMATHDHWGADEVDNIFRDNRIRGFNAALEEMAHTLELTFLDVYAMSLSAGRGSYGDVHHYHAGPLVGDIVSMSVASAYLDAVESALDSLPSPAACTIEIVEPMEGHGVVLGSADSRLWRNISIIVAASPECSGKGKSTMDVSVSVDGRLIGKQELIADSDGGSIAMITAKIGEGQHVVSVASVGPEGPLQQVSEFEVVPYHDTWTGSVVKSGVVGNEDDDDRDGMVHNANGRSIAVVACPPPLQHTDCILHAGAIMNGTDYDLLVLRDDCVEGFDLSSEMTRMRLKEWQASIGDREYVISCAQQTWNTDAWWLPPNAPSDFAIYPPDLRPDSNPDSEVVYESYVFISAQGVVAGAGEMGVGLSSSFSLAAAHVSMHHAGAHIAMATAESRDAAATLCEQPELGQWCARGRFSTGGIGVISLPRDPAILVLTSSAWSCVASQQIAHKEFQWISPLSLSMSCSPSGSLSACSMGQSCIFV